MVIHVAIPTRGHTLVQRTMRMEAPYPPQVPFCYPAQHFRANKVYSWCDDVHSYGNVSKVRMQTPSPLQLPLSYPAQQRRLLPFTAGATTCIAVVTPAKAYASLISTPIAPLSPPSAILTFT